VGQHHSVRQNKGSLKKQELFFNSAFGVGRSMLSVRHLLLAFLHAEASCDQHQR
jgi:hypothetical protein